MNNFEIESILVDLREQKSELQNFETKEASFDVPKTILKTVSAFANQEDGGTILLGVGDAPTFTVRGVIDVEAVQSKLVSMIHDCLSPVPSVTLQALNMLQVTVIAIHVDEVPFHQKPCFEKSSGLHGGAYKRVGDSNRVMSPYEVFLLQSNHTQPKEDIKPVPANLFSSTLLESSVELINYVRTVKEKSKSDYLLKLDTKAMLRARHILQDDVFSLMGTLVFDEYPQRFFPKLRITFLSFISREIEAEKRYLDNKVFEGPLIKMLETALNYLKLQLPARYEVKGLKGKSIPLIPDVALREAVLNAVAHRDYSPMALGREIQVRCYPDAIEIESPGGLYGGMRTDSLKTHQSVCRNAYLATMLEDLGVMENRGDGILSMCRALEVAGMPDPRFEDLIDSFKVTIFRAGHSRVQDSLSEKLSIDQFLLKYAEFKRGDIVRELDVSSNKARTILRHLLQEKKIECSGTGKGTKYRRVSISS